MTKDEILKNMIDSITNIYTAFESFGIPAGRILITHQVGQPGTTPSHIHHYD